MRFRLAGSKLLIALKHPNENMGRVFLVGAGPGDPGLLTIRGRRVLEKADVVVLDCLVNPTILRYLKPDARLILAGKSAGNHHLTQDETNAVLLKEARAGALVCRLKGGDPCLFGRGGEEALYLREHGIPFEFVPGVSSTIAALQYAGIPATQRGLASSFEVITGHEAPGKAKSSIDWGYLSSSKGTLVVLMCLGNLQNICQTLIDKGRPADTPAAVISRGTYAEQQVVTGHLCDISEKTVLAEIQTPAMLVVGKVVELNENLTWHQQRPLSGVRLLLLSSKCDKNLEGVCAELEDLGAQIRFCPGPRTAPVLETTAKLELEKLPHYQWIIFPNGEAILHFMHALEGQGLDSRSLAKHSLGVIGQNGVEVLKQFGLRADQVFTENDIPDDAVLIGPIHSNDTKRDQIELYHLCQSHFTGPKMKSAMEIEPHAVVITDLLAASVALDVLPPTYPPLICFDSGSAEELQKQKLPHHQLQEISDLAKILFKTTAKPSLNGASKHINKAVSS
jgi:uroporphyrinogen III methyltransferase/synthase